MIIDNCDISGSCPDLAPSSNNMVDIVEACNTFVADVQSGSFQLKGPRESNISDPETSDDCRIYENLAQYSEDVVAPVGTIKITLPKHWSNTMLRIRVSGYNYNSSAGGSWTLDCGGYNYTTSAWVNAHATLTGAAPFTTVRFGTDGTNCVILLGGVTTTWSYPKVVIERVQAGFSQQSDWGATGNGWAISRITDETGITVSATPFISQRQRITAPFERFYATQNTETVTGWYNSASVLIADVYSSSGGHGALRARNSSGTVQAMLNGDGLSYVLDEFAVGDTSAEDYQFRVKGGPIGVTSGGDTHLVLAGRVSAIPTMDTASAYIVTTASGGSYPYNGYGNLVLGSRHDGTQDIVFVTGSSGDVRTVIDGNGFFGHGTEDPSHGFTVHNINGTAAAFCVFHSYSGSNRIMDVVENNAEDGYLRLYNDGLTTVRIHSDGDSYFAGGNVGFNTNSPEAYVHIDGSSGKDTPTEHFGWERSRQLRHLLRRH